MHCLGILLVDLLDLMVSNGCAGGCLSSGVLLEHPQHRGRGWLGQVVLIERQRVAVPRRAAAACQPRHRVCKAPGLEADSQTQLSYIPLRCPVGIRVRFHIIGNARIKNVGKSQSCLVSKLPIIWKRTRTPNH